MIITYNLAHRSNFYRWLKEELLEGRILFFEVFRVTVEFL